MVAPEKAKGIETFTYLNGSEKAKSLAYKVQSGLVGVEFVNRGVKEANFHVLRETKTTSILIEVGFLDNTTDNNLFDSKRNEIVKAITKAILSQIGITYKEVGKVATPTPVKATCDLFKVQVGAFGLKSNADDLKKELEKLGYKPFIK